MPRAVGQHPRIIDRRTALLRDSLHRIDTQLGVEKLRDIPFKYRLSEAVFAGNCLISVNNTTPYNAVYGRVPHLLPNITSHEQPVKDGDNEALPGILRHSHRLREIAIQNIIEGTCRARVATASKTRTLPAAQISDYKIGDQVEIYRNPGNKDSSGWLGPGTICDLTMVSRGAIGVRWQGHVMNVKPGDCRHWMGFPVFLLANDPNDPRGNSMKYLQTAIGRLESETSILLGKHTSGAWTPQTKDHYQLYQSAMTVAQTNLRETCGLVRVGKASATLRPLGNNMSSILLWWLPERASDISECVADGTRINLRLMIGPMWARACFIQFVICPQEEAESFAKPTAEQSEDNAPPIPDGAADVGVLDTIVEEDPDDADDYLSYLHHDDPAMNKYVREAMKHIMEEDNDEL